MLQYVIEESKADFERQQKRRRLEEEAMRLGMTVSQLIMEEDEKGYSQETVSTPGVDLQMDAIIRESMEIFEAEEKQRAQQEKIESLLEEQAITLASFDELNTQQKAQQRAQQPAQSININEQHEEILKKAMTHEKLNYSTEFPVDLKQNKEFKEIEGDENIQSILRIIEPDIWDNLTPNTQKIMLENLRNLVLTALLPRWFVIHYQPDSSMQAPKKFATESMDRIMSFLNKHKTTKAGNHLYISLVNTFASSWKFLIHTLQQPQLLINSAYRKLQVQWIWPKVSNDKTPVMERFLKVRVAWITYVHLLGLHLDTTNSFPDQVEMRNQFEEYFPPLKLHKERGGSLWLNLFQEFAPKQLTPALSIWNIIRIE